MSGHIFFLIIEVAWSIINTGYALLSSRVSPVIKLQFWKVDFLFLIFAQISNFNFWWVVFEFLMKVSILMKISIFDEYLNFWWKFRFFLMKLWIFEEISIVMKISIWMKISIFDENFDFWLKFRFLMKILIFDENFHFWWKFRFLMKTSSFDETAIFWWKFWFLTFWFSTIQLLKYATEKRTKKKKKILNSVFHTQQLTLTLTFHT